MDHRPQGSYDCVSPGGLLDHRRRVEQGGLRPLPVWDPCACASEVVVGLAVVCLCVRQRGKAALTGSIVSPSVSLHNDSPRFCWGRDGELDNGAPGGGGGGHRGDVGKVVGFVSEMVAVRFYPSFVQSKSVWESEFKPT